MLQVLWALRCWGYTKHNADIGDEIKTISIDLTKNTPDSVTIPTTVTELSNRVIKLMPTFLNGCFEYDENGSIVISENEDMTNLTIEKGIFARANARDLLCVTSESITKENVLMSVRAEMKNGISISEGKEKKFKLFIENKLRCQQWLNIKCHIPNEWSGTPGRNFSFCLDQRHGGTAMNEMEFSFVPEALDKGKYNITIEISSQGRPYVLYIPVVLVVE